MSNTYYTKKSPSFALLEWMINSLNLKNNELLVYALLYSFSKNGNCYNGSIEYLSNRCNISRITVTRSLDSLVRKGLVEKKSYMKNGVMRVAYCHSQKYLDKKGCVNEDNYTFFTIYDWMPKKLNLSGHSLTVYALLYSFTSNVGRYIGNMAYICKRLNIAKSTVVRAIKKLSRDNMICCESKYSCSTRESVLRALTPDEIAALQSEMECEYFGAFDEADYDELADKPCVPPICTNPEESIVSPSQEVLDIDNDTFECNGEPISEAMFKELLDEYYQNAENSEKMAEKSEYDNESDFEEFLTDEELFSAYSGEESDDVIGAELGCEYNEPDNSAGCEHKYPDDDVTEQDEQLFTDGIPTEVRLSFENLDKDLKSLVHNMFLFFAYALSHRNSALMRKIINLRNEISDNYDNYASPDIQSRSG